MSRSNVLNTALAALIMLAGAAHAADVDVKDPWVRGTVPAQKATGAFMVLNARETVALTGAASPVAGVVEVHEMSMDGGVMKMRAMPRLDLPAGKPVELKPGGYHIMLMDLKQQLKPGDTVPITLKLEGKDKKAETLELKAPVRELTGGMAPAADHHHRH